jgi:nicotinamidase-related amidase
MSKTAVLVIDVQQGLCEGEGAAHDCAGTIARINRVTEKARAANVPVVFIQHEQAPGGLLAHATPAWQLAKGMVHFENDLRVRKTTCDSFLRTNLGTLLQSEQVEHVVVCGMHSEFCVDSTTRSALAHGFPVTLVSDAHTSAGNDALSAQQVIAHHNATLPNISSFGPRVTLSTSADIQF